MAMDDEMQTFAHKVRTNGDKIRAMTDEELAEWLIGHDNCDICALWSFDACRTESKCKKRCARMAKTGGLIQMTNGDKIRAMTDEELVMAVNADCNRCARSETCELRGDPVNYGIFVKGNIA